MSITLIIDEEYYHFCLFDIFVLGQFGSFLNAPTLFIINCANESKEEKESETRGRGVQITL